jgi:hypothetical protein
MKNPYKLPVVCKWDGFFTGLGDKTYEIRDANGLTIIADGVPNIVMSKNKADFLVAAVNGFETAEAKLKNYATLLGCANNDVKQLSEYIDKLEAHIGQLVKALEVAECDGTVMKQTREVVAIVLAEHRSKRTIR